MNDILSIVIRTMPGREHFLDKCLFILSGQTYGYIELIIVAQTKTQNDNLLMINQIAADYQRSFLRIKKVVHESTVDARAKSLNLGVENAEGRYLAFLDDDDKVYPHHYAKLISELTKADYAWGYADCIRAEYNTFSQLISRSRSFKKIGYSFVEHVKGNFIAIHSFIIDRAQIPLLPKFDEEFSLFEGYNFLYRLASKYKPLYVPFEGAEYCIWNDGSNSVRDGTELEMLQKWWVREIIEGTLAATLSNYTGMIPSDHTSFKKRLAEYHRAPSWKIARRIANIIRVLTGREPVIDVVPNTEYEAKIMMENLIRSITWEIMGPFRALKKLYGRVR